MTRRMVRHFCVATGKSNIAHMPLGAPYCVICKVKRKRGRSANA